MKQLLLFSLSCLLFHSVHAQFGVQAGGALYSGKATSDNVSFKFDSKFGFTGGVVYNQSFGDKIGFMPSLNFLQKGGKYKASEDGFDYSVDYTLDYIDLQLNVVYNINGFFAGVGPDLSYGIGGKSEFKSFGESDEEDVHFGSGSDDDFKALDFGANILAGYKLDNGLFFVANYNPGISNISPDSDSKYHNRGFALRIGYMFGDAK